MGVSIQRDSDVAVSHNVLQRLGIHAGFGHIGAECVSAHVGRDFGHLHPVNAVRCAHEMLAKVDELQQKWLSEGKPKIEIGVGINTGEAFVGNIGSEKRMEYTVIGDTVNLASRIESYNKIYKTNLLISSSTYACVKNIVDVIKISNVTIKKKKKKMDLYEVISLIG